MFLLRLQAQAGGKVGQAHSKISATKAALGAGIQTMESRLDAAEQIHDGKDDQIYTLKQEIEHQNDVPNLVLRRRLELRLSKRPKKTFDLWSKGATTCLVGSVLQLEQSLD